MLFIRTGQILKLSKAVKAFQTIVEESLSIIHRGTAKIIERATKPPLTISLLASFAHNWFLPNLSSFEQQHPEVSLRLIPSYHPIDLDGNSDIDVAIRLDRGDW